MSIDHQAGSSPAHPTSGRGKPLTPRQVAFAAMFGNAIELYDFLISAYLAGLATVWGALCLRRDRSRKAQDRLDDGGTTA